MGSVQYQDIQMATIGASLGSAYSFLMRIELGIPGYVLLENNCVEGLICRILCCEILGRILLCRSF